MYGSLFFWIVFDFPVFSKTGLCLPDLDAENGSLTLFDKTMIPPDSLFARGDGSALKRISQRMGRGGLLFP